MTARRRGLSIRWKLTLSYAGFLVVAGTVICAALLLILRWVPDGELTVVGAGGTSLWAPNRSDLLRAAVPRLSLVVAALAVVGLTGGWVLAGRVLRPLAALTAAVRVAGSGSLTHRVRLPGPRDEIRELADHFDDMLGQLERAFGEQRRFAANASHELRTPVAAARTMLEVARADPGGRDVDQLLARLTELNDRQATTLEAIVHLARAERADVVRSACDLVSVVEDALEEVDDDITVELDVPDGTVPVLGNRPLLDHLVANLVRNACVHNVDRSGTVWVEVSRDPDGAVLVVSNTGSVLAPELVRTLTEPFVRGAGRTRGPGGSGLGLAIVASVVEAHGADLQLVPRAGGGLTARVRFAHGVQHSRPGG